MNKQVLMRIEVPDSKFCHEFSSNTVCQYLSHVDGSSVCMKGFCDPTYSHHGLLKPEECAILQEEPISTKIHTQQEILSFTYTCEICKEPVSIKGKIHQGEKISCPFCESSFIVTCIPSEDIEKYLKMRGIEYTDAFEVRYTALIHEKRQNYQIDFGMPEPRSETRFIHYCKDRPDILWGKLFRQTDGELQATYCRKS